MQKNIYIFLFCILLTACGTQRSVISSTSGGKDKKPFKEVKYNIEYKGLPWVENISKPIKGVAGVAGAGLKYAIPKAGKLYAKAALGVAAGTLGVAAGLASDNDMNILKYGGAGAATGWAVGGAAGGIIVIIICRNGHERKIG